jgi:hypothetical protein
MKTPGLWKGKEAKGIMPAMGVKLEIEEIEKTETGENSKVPGALMYVGRTRVVEPNEYKGRSLMEWFPIGTKEDKRGKKEETWNRPEAGPGRLLKLLKTAKVPTSDDDEEWMESAVGCTTYAHVIVRADETGEKRNRVGMYYDEDDEEFVGVGEMLEASPNGRGGRVKKAKAGARDDDDAKPRRAKAKDDDEGEDDDDDKKSKKAKEEEEEEEDDKPRRTARSKGKDKDDDEDED